MILRVPLSPELRRWILGYGKDVEVLEPKSLREDIRREWLAALRGREGQIEALRLTARKARPRATTKAALALSEGTRAHTRRAVPGPRSKQ
jgi:hypothetical protein